MAVDDSEPVESLVTTGKRVCSQFSVLEKLADVDNDDKNSIVNELQRFELWAVNHGLYHGGHSSLDYRFRDSPPLFKYAYKLLRDLETGLSQLKEVLDDPQDSETEAEVSDDDSEEDFASYQTEPLSKAHLGSITATIDRLYHLSFKIRNPAMRIGFSRALKHREVDPDTGVNLFEVFTTFDQNHLAELFRCLCHRHPDNLKDHYLVQRLARANTRRRQQFRYWRKRKLKYETYSKPVEMALRTPQNLNVRLERDLSKGPQSAPSQPSTATWLNAAQVKLDDDASTMSTSTFFIVADEKGGDHVSIPPPPAIGSGVKEFECPYCFMICPRKAITKKAWETHIFRDLRPYICTFEDCEEPDQQYDTLSDWMAHEAIHHQVAADPSVGHQKYTRDCPLCLLPNANPVHIACHLRRIACFSLPRSAGDKDGSSIGSGLSDRAEIESHSSERGSMESVMWEAWSEHVPAIRELSRSEVEKTDESDVTAGMGPDPVHESTDKGIDEHIGEEPDRLWAGGHDSGSSSAGSPEERLGLLLGNRIELNGILGIGDHGTAVYSAVDVKTAVPYAVKAFNKRGVDSREQKLRQREMKLHHLASQHPNVTSLIRIMDSVDCTFLVIEICPEGDLFENITERGLYVGNDHLAKHVFLQILDAVHFCHSIRIYHRDLKPENFLVADHGKTVKLADFSLATTDPFTSDSDCGSALYMSPECLSNHGTVSSYASAPNDVWSLGIILINLTCGRNPWKRASIEDSLFRSYSKDPFFLRSILPLSKPAVLILSRIFELDPTKRITIPELRRLILDCPCFTESAHTPTSASQFNAQVPELKPDPMANTPAPANTSARSPSERSPQTL